MFTFKHLASKTAEAIAETLYPTRCVHCDEPNTLLCTDCRNALFAIDQAQACPRCGAPFGAFTCTECVIPGSLGHNDEELPSGFPFAAARAVYVYEGPAKSVITAYKDACETRLDTLIAHDICRTICGEPGNWVLTCDALLTLPANPKHVRKRGFDHMKRIAQLCSHELGLPLIDPLCNTHNNSGLLDQRLLSAEERKKNKLNSISIKPEYMHTPTLHTSPYLSPSASASTPAHTTQHSSLSSRPAIPTPPSSNISPLQPISTPPFIAPRISSSTLPPTLLLIDDVMTTGASVSAASDALLSAGACRVMVAVYARVW